MLTNIRKRQHELNTSYKSNGSFARLYDMVYETHDMNKADMLFKNILEVDSNHDMAIMKSLDLLVELYNHVPPAEVNRERQKVLESITKVRDASQFKAYLQRKMALHKGRLKNKINKKISDASEKIKDLTDKAANGVKDALGINAPSEDQAATAQMETLNMALELACEVATYDRIIFNYEKISKRFDLDKIVLENVLTADDAKVNAIKVAKLIDTYNMRDIQKFKIATEEYLYVLTKNGCKYEIGSVVEAMKDYFLINSSDPTAFTAVLESTLEELSKYNPLSNSDIGKIVKSTIIEADPKEVIDLGSKKVDLYIAQFKFDKGLDCFKLLLKNIYTDLGLDVYIDSIENIILTLKSINADLTEYANILIDFNNKVLEEKSKDKLDKLILIASLYAKYKEDLNMDNDEALAAKFDDFISTVESISTDTTKDKEINVDALSEKLDIMNSAMENIYKRNLIECVEDSIDRYDTQTIVNIANIAKHNPSLLDPEELSAVFKRHLRDCRAIKHKTADDYVRIDNLKDKAEALRQYNDNVEDCSIIDHNNANIDEAIAHLKVLEGYSNCIYDFAKYPTVVNEMDIINTIKVASQKIKSKIGELDDSVVNISRQFDAQMDQLKRIIDNKEFESENREAVIAGNIIPKASRIVKLAITSGIAALINPALSVVVILGYLGMSMKAQSKERRKVLEEIDIELEMTKRYLKKAEDDNQLEKQRELLKIKKRLEGQRARLAYNMTFKHGEHVSGNSNRDDD